MKAIWVLMIVVVSSCSSDNHWSYYGANSPDDWSKISSKYQSCGDGHFQSPIDLSLQRAKQLNDPIKFYYHDSKTELVDNGHTIQVNFHEENHIVLEGQRYFLEQLHFHTHSEHSLDGVYYPIEMHLVHKSKAGELAVLGFFVDIDSPKIEQFGFFEGLSHKAPNLIRLSKLMSFVGPHYYYRGSLTTPPCTEGVHWVVFDKHIKLHRSQVEQFRAIYSRNYRPIVPRAHEGQVFHSDI